MTTTETIGCPFCSNSNEVTSPDPEYTKVSNTDKQGYEISEIYMQ